MLSDRHYMREVSGHPGFNMVKCLMWTLGVMFALQYLTVRWLGSSFLYEHLPLSVPALRAGQVWTLLTYDFLQSTNGYTGGLVTLIINLLGLYFLGNLTVERFGQKGFALLYFGFILAGGAAWCAASAAGGLWPLFGTITGIAGLFTLFCCFNANEKSTFWIFLVFPVTIKPKYLAMLWAAVDLCGFLFYERKGIPSPFWNGHAANLGAMAAAAGFYFVHEHWLKYGPPARPTVELPHWLRKTPRAARPPAYHVNLSNRDDLRAEVDRILDKINSAGFNALTADEKRILDEAKDLLSRR
ncbi:MAG TPA: rhomboid family intramembrane serine protease [Opitutaceae bacterium]|jgi:membrane associated rhomboid family serine protease|nr:rhomboid family intramembrane serine protease [Opitutaceae bacterium]